MSPNPGSLAQRPPWPVPSQLCPSHRAMLEPSFHSLPPKPDKILELQFLVSCLLPPLNIPLGIRCKLFH